jgi:hypothetical protein
MTFGDRVNARRVVLPHRRQERLAGTGAVEQRPPLLSDIRGLIENSTQVAVMIRAARVLVSRARSAARRGRRRTAGEEIVDDGGDRIPAAEPVIQRSMATSSASANVVADGF